MLDEPTIAGYCVLAIGAACYLAFAMLWHWTFGKPSESHEEIERRTQFSRSEQDDLDEMWDHRREAVRREDRSRRERDRMVLQLQKNRSKPGY